VPTARVHPALQESAEQPGIPSDDPQVGGQQHVHAGTHCRPAHRRHRGHTNLPQPIEGVVDLPHALVGLGRRRVLAGRSQRRDVPTRAERLPNRPDHQRSDVRPRVHLVERCDQLVRHRRRQRVAPVRGVQRHDCDGAVHLELYLTGSGHSPTFLPSGPAPTPATAPGAASVAGRSGAAGQTPRWCQRLQHRLGSAAGARDRHARPTGAGLEGAAA